MRVSLRFGLAVVAVVVAATFSALALGGTTAERGQAVSACQSGQITVLYSSSYVFNSVELAKKWWDAIAVEWKKKFPNVTLKLDGTAGTDIDEMNKAALQFKANRGPDVLQHPTTFTGQFASSGYLLPLENYLTKTSAPFWSDFPAPVRAIGEYQGKVYGINTGNNDSGLMFNKTMLAKAGVKMPWKPRTWSDILAAARKVKKAYPDVWPIWLAAGTAAGPTNVLQGSGNLIYGSKTPTMFLDDKKQWVIDSPGLREVLGFYKAVYQQGLGAPTSETFRPDAVGRPVLLFKEGKVAIAIGSNWYPTVWANKDSLPWPTGLKIMGVAPVPTSKGQAPQGASTLGGWAMGINSKSKNPDCAWAFLKMVQETKNILNMALWSGFVPPSQKTGKLPKFVNYAPPYMAAFNSYQKFGKALPSDGNFPVYARALNNATGLLAQHPSTSIDAALKVVRDTVTQQLGPGATVTLR